MKRFTHERSHTWTKQALAIVLFLFIFLILTLGLSGIAKKTHSQRAESLQQAISRSITHCYATEGHYPESLAYLKEHYGISYNTDEFFIDYQVLGENIFPDVTIIEKQEER